MHSLSLKGSRVGSLSKSHVFRVLSGVIIYYTNTLFCSQEGKEMFETRLALEETFFCLKNSAVKDHTVEDNRKYLVCLPPPLYFLILLCSLRTSVAVIILYNSWVHSRRHIIFHLLFYL